ncbi:hypothetical protein HYPSUDRAFT_45430 [Hypholoma sublateritium FD-334 SS-4]|uniref:Uncharacterized protein n=1 Tax=Hypholoma sublateritium (strain FD-334 SS-4) TaxID=945553 RepID=A0A0D2KUF7_HYPSF|nr:hypothetical protein HYPSUDRAFT_45430 [Hypholoma sublateritium FD-334 SS-4]
MTSLLNYFSSTSKNRDGRIGITDILIPDSDSDGDSGATGALPDGYYSVNKYSAAVLFEVFLYGIYSTLFAICIRVLLKNKRTTQRMLLACAMIMFSLATVDVVLELSFLFWFVVKGDTIPDPDLHFKFLIYITSNVIADSLVIYRCHSVWNRSKRVIVLPCILLISGTACGYAFIGLSKEEYRFRKLLVAFLFTTVTLNMLVTVLMAGRIWWIARKARSILGPGLSSKYNTMIAIIVESGVIYSIYVVLDVVFPDLLLDAGLAQVVGIVPTLIIVQIGLGMSTHDADTSASVVRTDGRTMANTTEFQYDIPPSGSPPPPSPISLPPVTFSIQAVQRTNRPYVSNTDRGSDAECGYL